MIKRFALVALALLSLTPAAAQETASPPAVVRVSLETSEGVILLELEKQRAPLTTANFLRYLDAKRFDGSTFYRAMTVAPGYGLIQGGAKPHAKGPFPPVAHEPTSQTGLSHTDGAISMARAAPGTATSDFFITVGAMTSLDADPKAPGDNLGFAAFGRVVEGMEVVHRILAAPTSPTEGEGVMRGQMLAPTVKIISARRVAGAQ